MVDKRAVTHGRVFVWTFKRIHAASRVHESSCETSHSWTHLFVDMVILPVYTDGSERLTAEVCFHCWNDAFI